MKDRTLPVIQAVLWDIDGTLIDSEDLHYQVIADWCGEQGFSLTPEDNENLLGKSMNEKWHILRKSHSLSVSLAGFKEDCARRYCKAVSGDLQRKAPLELFRNFARCGIAQACVSNGDRTVVEANLKALEIDGLVSLRISGDDLENGKPDPEPYLRAAQRLGVTADECLVVEDSSVGVTAGLAAGMRVVAWPLEKQTSEGIASAHFTIRDKKDFPLHLLPL
ncbi:MAG: haloacid dehalogenase [Deltaproteobacteria bacterium]|nr:MAG: haloacid dehalogenase [Deltaproteobacteria bacterium]